MRAFRHFCFIASLILMAGCSNDDNDDSTRLATPANVRLELNTGTSLTYAWDAVEGAVTYYYRLTDESGKTIRQNETKETSVTIEGLTGERTYFFTVGAYSSGSRENVAYSDVLKGTTGEPGSVEPGDPTKLGLPEWENDGLPRAFPGAEGGGMYVTGGRGGTVYHVTTLADNTSPGSLRHAINQKGARTIVFDVSGIIELTSTLSISNGDITIAGQTAPGDGICLKNYSLQVKADNVIIRYIRCRMGDEKQTEDDAMWGRFLKDVIIDHCSMSWSTDECSSFYANQNFTMQWCILSESLRNSVHGKGAHGYGAIWGGVNASFHHNLLAHHESRNPRFDGGDVYDGANRFKNGDRAVDYRNCVVYNFSNYPAYGGEAQKINYIGNYYKWGPGSLNGPGDTQAKRRQYIYLVQGIKEGTDYGCPSIYIGGNSNYLETADGYTSHGVNEDNWKGFVYDNSNKGQTDMTKLASPVRIMPDGKAAKVTYHTASGAFEQVMEYAGASKTRDAVDTRIVSETCTGTATYMDGGNGSKNGYIDTQSAVGGWPVYNSLPAETDTDGDGIPDWWEDEFGLNKNLAADGKTISLDPSGRYTNLELYLHWLVKDITSNQVKNGNYIAQ